MGVIRTGCGIYIPYPRDHGKKQRRQSLEPRTYYFQFRMSNFKKESYMTATKPPVMSELQNWKSYEEIILKWLRITTIPHEKIVGSILAVGLYKHAIIYKLAENIADEYDFIDIFESSILGGYTG